MIGKVFAAFLIVSTLCLITMSASAYSLSNVQISPSDYTIIGNDISASFSIKFAPYQMYTANPNNTIRITTAIQDPIWSRVTVLDGQSSQKQTIRGNTVNLEGWDIAYPIGTGEYLNITLNGRAPVVPVTGRIPIVNIVEYDINGSVIPSNQVNYERVIISPSDLDYGIAMAQKDLLNLQLDIQIRENQGFDVSGAQEQFKDANQGLTFVKTLTPEKYLTGLNRLKEINAAITMGNDMLEREVTQREIDKATTPIRGIDKVIDWFASNKSTASYSGLAPVIRERNIAGDMLTGASEAMNARDYDRARAQAKDAFESANRTLYHSAIPLQKRAMDPLTPVWDNIIIVYIGLGATVLYLLLRKKKRKPKKMENREDVGNREESPGPESGNPESQGSTGRTPAETRRV